MRTRSNNKAFTIIELLVVVSIIALLIGILLPAIGKARDQAHVTRSQANLRQLGVSHATYGSEWNDNQWTLAPHGLAQYGNNLNEAVSQFWKAMPNSKSLIAADNGNAGGHLGWANHPTDGEVNFWYADDNSHAAIVPQIWGYNSAAKKGWGSYRMINARSFNTYVSGRFYDSTFYAPKDRALIEAIGQCYEAPGEFCLLTEEGPYFSSYVLSPAAMYAPDVYGRGKTVAGSIIFSNPGSLRSPTFSQARYPDLKTHMLEHHWLQGARRECHPNFTELNEDYDGCRPYLFNHGRNSVPVTLFYDGHVANLGVPEAVQANAQHRQQLQSESSKWNDDIGLWKEGLTMQGTNGYWEHKKYAPAGVPAGAVKTGSFHILTVDGILGRDTLSR